MPPRVDIAHGLLFDKGTLKILMEFDSYAQAELAKGSEPSPAGFHALRSKELGFSPDSLKRWLLLRRRYGPVAPKLKR
jgi:hypothetical protein